MTRQPAQRTRRGRSETRPPPEDRNERVRAKPQRRSWPEQPGHRSAKPATSACACASSSTTITAGSFSHRTILATGPAVGKGQVVLKPGPPNRPKASRPTTWIKRARTPRNRHHHAGDGTGSTRLPIEPSQPSSPTLTPRGIHVVIHRVALQRVVTREYPSDQRKEYALRAIRAGIVFGTDTRPLTARTAMASLGSRTNGSPDIT